VPAVRDHAALRRAIPPGAAAQADAAVAEIAEADVIGVPVFWRLSRGTFGPVNGYGLAAGSSFRWCQGRPTNRVVGERLNSAAAAIVAIAIERLHLLP
jgi:hypothetical protein